MKVAEFVRKLRQKIADKKAFIEKQRKLKRENQVLKIDPREKIWIEMECINLCETLQCCEMTMKKDVNTEKFYKAAKKKMKFEQRFFYFSEDTLMWKNHVLDKNVSGRAYLAAVQEIQLDEAQTGDGYLYFRIGIILIVLKFETEEE